MEPSRGPRLSALEDLMGNAARAWVRTGLIGVGATAVMDLGGEVVRPVIGVPPLDYRLLGRWVGHMPRGTLRHENIREAAPVPAEKHLGLALHYGIGVAFAGLLVTAVPSWTARPTPGPALAVRLGTVLAPWLVMQPAFGMGIAGSRTPDPARTRRHSLRAHATYGAGLYLAGAATARRRR